MKIVHTHGRKSLTPGTWLKAEASQGASNCVAAQLQHTTGVLLGDTQNPNMVLGLDSQAWTTLVRTAA